MLKLVVAEKVLSSGFQILFILLAGKVLDSQQMAAFVLFLATIGFSNFIGQFGLNGYLIRKLKNTTSKDATISNAFFVRFIANLLGTLFLVCAFTSSDDIVFRSLTQGYAAVNIFRALEVYELYLQSESKFQLLSGVKIIVNTIVFIAKIWILFSSFEPFSIGLLHAASFNVPFIVYFLVLLTQGNTMIKLSSLRWLFQKKMILLIMPVVMGSGLALINSRIDQILIRSFLPPSDLATYGLAVQVTEGAMIFITSAMMYYFPILLSANRGTPSPKEQTTIQIVRNVMRTAWGFTLFNIALSAPIFYFLFHEKYALIANIIVLHSITLIPLAFREFMSRWIIITNQLKFSLYSHGLAALTNVALNLILLPLLGIYGASIASIFSYTIGAFAVFLFSRHLREHVIGFARVAMTPWR